MPLDVLDPEVTIQLSGYLGHGLPYIRWERLTCSLAYGEWTGLTFIYLCNQLTIYSLSPSVISMTLLNRLGETQEFLSSSRKAFTFLFPLVMRSLLLSSIAKKVNN